MNLAQSSIFQEKKKQPGFLLPGHSGGVNWYEQHVWTDADLFDMGQQKKKNKYDLNSRSTPSSLICAIKIWAVFSRIENVCFFHSSNVCQAPFFLSNQTSRKTNPENRLCQGFRACLGVFVWSLMWASLKEEIYHSVLPKLEFFQFLRRTNIFCPKRTQK